MLPILHLNGYKIAGPTVLGRMGDDELEKLFQGYGYHPYFVEGDEPEPPHRRMAEVLDQVVQEIQAIQRAAREEGRTQRPPWPMIVLRTPKGWTGPKVVDGQQVEGTFRSHQVPLSEVRDQPGAPRPARVLDAQLPSGGALRREGLAGAGAEGASAQAAPPHERQPARQRRTPLA